MAVDIVATVQAPGFRWLEVWDKPECDGGKRLAPIISRDEVLEVKTDFSDRLTFSVMPGTAAAAYLTQGRVVRTRFTNPADDDEYGILIAAPAFGTNSNLIRVVCVPWVVWILTNSGTVVDYGSGGIPEYSGELLATTPADALDVLLNFLSTRRGISCVVAGTIEPTTTFDYRYADANGIAFVNGITKHPQIQCEFRAFRNGSTNFLLSIARQISITAPVPVIRTRYNLRSHVAQSDATEMANVVRPRGIAVDGARRGLEEMTVKIVSITGTSPKLIEVEGSPIPFNDWLKDSYIVADNATFDSEQIVNTIAPNIIAVASSTGFAVGNVCMFRDTSGSNGLEVTTITDPGSIDDHTYVEKEYPLSGLFGLRNFLQGADLSDFDSGDTSPPFNWAAAISAGGTLAVAKESGAGFVMHGQHSMKVSNSGVATNTVHASAPFWVHPRVGKSKFSIVVWVKVAAPTNPFDGALVAYISSAATMTSPPTAPSGGQPNSAHVIVPSDGATQWYRLDVPGFDATVAGINSYWLHIVYGGITGLSPGAGVVGSAAIYVDSAMVVMVEASGGIPFIGSNENALRDAAILKVESHSRPLVQHEVSLLDLSDQVASLKITTGGKIRLVNPDLGTDEEVRVMSYRRVLRNVAESQVTLATRAQTLTQRLAAA